MFEDGIDINPLQPLRDATDSKHAPHGGWELVLEYCERQAELALEANDFVVIHIDTDCGDHQNFGLNLLDQEGREKTFDLLIEGAKEIIIRRIGCELHGKNSQRIIFAIAVHSVESWLLLCLFNDNSIKNSFDRLNRKLIKSDCRPIVKNGKSYYGIMNDISKKCLKNIPTGNSLDIFVNTLNSIPT